MTRGRLSCWFGQLFLSRNSARSQNFFSLNVKFYQYFLFAIVSPSSVETVQVGIGKLNTNQISNTRIHEQTNHQTQYSIYIKALICKVSSLAISNCKLKLINAIFIERFLYDTRDFSADFYLSSGKPTEAIERR